MADETIDYPINGTVDDLSSTCMSDEDVFRGPLTKLERVVDTKGTKGVRATYEPIPFTEKFVRRKLAMFDITGMSSQDQIQLTQQQIAKGFAEAFKGKVFLGGKAATVIVYRQVLKPK